MRKTIISLIVLASFCSLKAYAEELQLAENAPERYIVVPGDTLWSIAGKFLKDPWQWPKLWGMNREQIKNPHRIYPGDVLVLDKSGGSPGLRVARETVKLKPQVRVEQTSREAIPSIPAGAIEPFLSQPLVIEANALDSAPRIVGTKDERVVIARGDTAYALGLSQDKGKLWQIYRLGKTLVDPDTKEVLGHEAVYLGDAKVANFGEVSAIDIVKSRQEISRGDRLVPAPGLVFNTYAPHAPDKQVRGRIIAAYESVAEVGRNAIVTINRGTRDGLEMGHVLAIYSGGNSSSFRAYALKGEKDAAIKLPEERSGLLFIFRTFDRVSYGLVMQTHGPVHVLDTVQTP